jgi:myo-inositol 2-dehydrogenase / D-chiro-inositol 1-dehydrogenase
VSDPVRVGLVGSGRIGRVHAEAYDRVTGGGIVGCCDARPDVAAQLAGERGYRVFDSYEAMLASDDVDAVLIATPNWLHAQMTIDALAAGKDTFCQKPMALTVEEANQVTAAAAGSDRILQFGFMLRFTPPFPEVKRLLDERVLGDIIAARAAVFGWEPNADWFYDKKTGGGVILDTLIHFVDLARWLVGDIDSVYTEGGAFVLEGAKKHGSPDNASVLWHHANGASTGVFVSWTAGHGNFTLEIYGTNGSLAIDLVEKQVSRLFLRTPAQFDGQTLAQGWNYPDLVWAYSYSAEQQHFVDSVRSRDRRGAAGAQDARDALAVAIATQRSLDEREVVRIA